MTMQPDKTKSRIGGASAPAAPATATTNPPAIAPLVAAIFAVVLVVLLTVLAGPAVARADAGATAAGAAVYKDKCMGCHGADGSGSTPMGKALKAQDLKKPEIQAQTDAQLAAAVTNGKGKMPAQKGNLTAAQIGQVVDYIRTLAKGK